MGELLTLDQIDDATKVRRRSHRVATVTERDDTVSLDLGDRILHLPSWVAPALRHAVTATELTPGDLSAHLDEPGRLTLVRRLVRAWLFAR